MPENRQKKIKSFKICKKNQSKSLFCKISFTDCTHCAQEKILILSIWDDAWSLKNET